MINQRVLSLPLHLASDGVTIVRPHEQAEGEFARQQGTIVARVDYETSDGQSTEDTKEYARRFVETYNVRFATPTIREWLDANFEGGSRCVEGVDLWGDTRIAKARLCGSENTALLQHTCGGDAIISFTPWHKLVSGRPLLIVRDDTAGEKWDVTYLRQNAPTAPRPPRPFAKLRLVQTA